MVPFLVQEKPTNTASHTEPEAKSSGQTAKEERIRELNRQVDALQNAIRQVRISRDLRRPLPHLTIHTHLIHGFYPKIQALHHDLVAFCSELKSAEEDVSADGLDSAQLRQKLELVKGRLSAKKQKVHTLRDHVRAAHQK